MLMLKRKHGARISEEVYAQLNAVAQTEEVI